MRFTLCTFALVLACLTAGKTAFAAPEEDRVESLPLFGKPPTPQYSGYLNATDGCDTDTNGAYCKIHYWYAAPQCQCTERPVVLWMNGGPGSSSILGFLQENGPLLMNATGGLMRNPWAWTREAHMIVLESPVGVGYSYCANQMEGKICRNTDKYTASANRAALVDFFQTKFPELASNDFFITGESYAGVYIPTLAYEILQHAPQINLKGLAVGDPCTDNDAQRDSMDALWYSHKYGLVPDADFDLLWNKCRTRLGSALAMSSQEERKQRLQNPGPNFVGTNECKMAFRKFLMSSSGGLSQSWNEFYIDDYSLFAPATNLEDIQMAAYLNRPDVRAALHVTEAPIEKWPYPKGGFDYTKEYDACNDEAAPGAKSMLDFYRKLAPKLQRIFVYNGDSDPCVTYEGTRTAMTRLGFAELDGGGYRPWFYNHTAAPLSVLVEKAAMFGPDLSVQPLGAQFGGEVVDYEHGLSFLTFHGSGHMVPQFRTQAALHMLHKLIRFEDLSPLWPSNETLVSMSPKEFHKEMDTWTEKAMKSPYVLANDDAIEMTN